MLSSVFCLYGQNTDSLMKEVLAFQAAENEHYLNKETSPLPKKERKHFDGHDFYEIDMNYVVNAAFDLIEDPDTIIMKTSAGTDKVFCRYAILSFELHGEKCQLVAYQNVKQVQIVGQENALFIPFKDATSGEESYGGGRYLDVINPDSGILSLNFNLAYNPYCAYTSGWFCPIPPAENTIKVAVKAGAKAPKH